MEREKLRVAELFAGVGGFRIGLEKSDFKVVWSNQFEPSSKIQHASMVYEARFGSDNHSNQDIETVSTDTIPDHDLLCGGFPCQDYSVATTLQNSKGLIGKKGVLWWSIYRILKEKKTKPKYLLFENVDRLLKSPSKQRGRDFAVMLQSLNELGYIIEWRVINAADYGFPQRRRRIFFIGYHNTSPAAEQIKRSDNIDWLTKLGVFARTFPVQKSENLVKIKIDSDLAKLSEGFNKNEDKSPFRNTGLMIGGEVFTIETIPNYEGPFTVLGDVIESDEVGSEFYISDNESEMWTYLKGSKTIERMSNEGFLYKYSEGGMIFPDPLDKPSRTIITGEGGKSPSRFKHVISTKNGFRRLTPLELERLNMFPDNHTLLEGISNTKRAFFMGNALVVGVVEKLGIELSNLIING